MESNAYGDEVPMPRAPVLVKVEEEVEPKVAVNAVSTFANCVVEVALAATTFANDDVEDALMPEEKLR